MSVVRLAAATGFASSPRTPSPSPSESSDGLGSIAREHKVWVVIGVEEREQHGGTIYNTLL